MLSVDDFRLKESITAGVEGTGSQIENLCFVESDSDISLLFKSDQTACLAPDNPF
jgi:hypothetical protein